MKIDAPLPVPPLPESARRALLKQAELLARDFTGEFRVRCRKGGVQGVSVTEEFRGDELPEEPAA